MARTDRKQKSCVGPLPSAAPSPPRSFSGAFPRFSPPRACRTPPASPAGIPPLPRGPGAATLLPAKSPIYFLSSPRHLHSFRSRSSFSFTFIFCSVLSVPSVGLLHGGKFLFHTLLNSGLLFPPRRQIPFARNFLGQFLSLVVQVVLLARKIWAFVRLIFAMGKLVVQNAKTAQTTKTTKTKTN